MIGMLPRRRQSNIEISRTLPTYSSWNESSKVRLMSDRNEADRKFDEVADTVLKSVAVLVTGMQAIGGETVGYSKKSLKDAAAHFQALGATNDIETMLELQSGFARSACEGWAAEAIKLSDMYISLAKSACQPFEAPVAPGKATEMANAA